MTPSDTRLAITSLHLQSFIFTIFCFWESPEALLDHSSWFLGNYCKSSVASCFPAYGDVASFPFHCLVRSNVSMSLPGRLTGKVGPGSSAVLPAHRAGWNQPASSSSSLSSNSHRLFHIWVGNHQAIKDLHVGQHLLINQLKLASFRQRVHLARSTESALEQQLFGQRRCQR